MSKSSCTATFVKMTTMWHHRSSVRQMILKGNLWWGWLLRTRSVNVRFTRWHSELNVPQSRAIKAHTKHDSFLHTTSIIRTSQLYTYCQGIEHVWGLIFTLCLQVQKLISGERIRSDETWFHWSVNGPWTLIGVFTVCFRLWSNAERIKVDPTTHFTYILSKQ